MRKHHLRSLLVSVFFLFHFAGAQAAVWQTTNTWNAEWENRYQQWVTTDWRKDFFARPGWYQNLMMDCADTVYAMRIIFAAENGLPYVMKDPTGGRALISNEMTRWDAHPPAKRLRSFLVFVYGIGSTLSLPNDSYPVAVNRNAITSGTFILTDRKSHHSWTVKKVSETGIPFLLYSSRPAKTLLLERNEFPSMEFTFPNGLKPESNAGFRAFRWPEHVARPVWEVPGYSLEQYQIPARSWIPTVQKRLQLREETAEARLMRVLSSVCNSAKERVDVVNEGWQAAQRIGGRCFNAQEYDDYSTPSRDKRLRDAFTDLAEAYATAKSARFSVNATLQAQVESVLAGDAGMDPQNFCSIEVIPGVSLTLGQIYARSLGGRLSNNPHDSREARWGLQSFPGSKARSCTVY